MDEDWKAKYAGCRVCEKPLDDALREVAERKYEKQACSTACLRKELMDRYACCERAEILPCVCVFSTTCPDHGPRHHGSHD